MSPQRRQRITCCEASAELAAKLDNKPTTELKDSSQQSYEELHAKLRDELATKLYELAAKLK